MNTEVVNKERFEQLAKSHLPVNPVSGVEIGPHGAASCGSCKGCKRVG